MLVRPPAAMLAMGRLTVTAAFVTTSRVSQDDTMLSRVWCGDLLGRRSGTQTRRSSRAVWTEKFTFKLGRAARCVYGYLYFIA